MRARDDGGINSPSAFSSCVDNPRGNLFVFCSRPRSRDAARLAQRWVSSQGPGMADARLGVGTANPRVEVRISGVSEITPSKSPMSRLGANQLAAARSASPRGRRPWRRHPDRRRAPRRAACSPRPAGPPRRAAERREGARAPRTSPRRAVQQVGRTDEIAARHSQRGLAPRSGRSELLDAPEQLRLRRAPEERRP